MVFRPLRQNSFAVSVMYDAILFLVMVSLAGVILLPAIHSPIAVKSSIDKNREQIADDALHSYLVTRVEEFDYLFCGSLLDTVARSLGVNTSADRLYGSLAAWLLAHEQRHKTYASLLAEDLGCQFHVPVALLGADQLNLFTAAFDSQLRNDTRQFFDTALGEKYGYNLSAWWHPIRGVTFGGEFSIGAPPPSADTYVSQSILSMPYAPVFMVGNQTVVLTKYWLMHHLFDGNIEFGRSSIPEIANITCVLENYTNGHPPFDQREIAEAFVRENLSVLVYGFLLFGVANAEDVTIFPGIVNLTLANGFESIKDIAGRLVSGIFNESFGAVVRTMDGVFSGLDLGVASPLSSALLEVFNATFSQLVNGSFHSFDEVFDACITMVSSYVTGFLKSLIDPILDGFVDRLFDGIDLVKDFANALVDWLFDRIALSTAEVSLTIWEVRG